MVTVPISNVIVGVVATLCGVLLTLYIKDTTRKTIKEEFGSMIETALAKFKVDFLSDMNDTFRRSAECNIMMQSGHKGVRKD